jgi:DNA-directed RNA polymerase specialized sigma24 family protein
LGGTVSASPVYGSKVVDGQLDFPELSEQETAGVLGIGRRMVGSRVSRPQARLRAELERMGD